MFIFIAFEFNDYGTRKSNRSFVLLILLFFVIVQSLCPKGEPARFVAFHKSALFDEVTGMYVLPHIIFTISHVAQMIVLIIKFRFVIFIT